MQERTLKSLSSRQRLGERGQALIEYTMIVALIGMGLVVMLSVMANATRTTVTRTNTSVSRQAIGYGGGGGGVSGTVSGSVRPTPVTPASPSEPADSAGGESPDSAAGTHASSGY